MVKSSVNKVSNVIRFSFCCRVVIFNVCERESLWMAIRMWCLEIWCLDMRWNRGVKRALFFTNRKNSFAWCSQIKKIVSCFYSTSLLIYVWMKHWLVEIRLWVIIRFVHLITSAWSIECDCHFLLQPARILPQLALGTVGVAVTATNSLKANNSEIYTIQFIF